MQIVNILKAAVPHFTSDIAACHTDEQSGELLALYPVEWYIEGEHEEPEAVVTLSYFTWLGVRMFIKQTSDAVTYRRYLEIVDEIEGNHEGDQ